MDLTASMAASEIAARLNVSTTEALQMLLSSRAGARIYDPDLKYWCDGPSAAAEAFYAEYESGSVSF